MTVAELIEALQLQPKDREVHFAYNYGDRARTLVAPAVTSVELGFVTYSSYCDTDRVVEDEEQQNDEKSRAVLILS